MEDYAREFDILNTISILNQFCSEFSRIKHRVDVPTMLTIPMNRADEYFMSCISRLNEELIVIKEERQMEG